ncbi:MAG: Gmad2 immunoglobulin-like domain-containing protein, partial [Candidatus Harrisonbacteria bacterium]|nr:Gmad2 immunoglobulin-like domain-containing protein [Candidatus Harrisonbacteria bacterium]
ACCMNKTFNTVILLVLALLIVAIVFAVVRDKEENGDGSACTLEAKLCIDGSFVGRQGPNCEFAACPDPGSVQQATNIKVYSPQPGDTVTSPVVILGEARVFENAFSYRVKDIDGNVLADAFSTANSPDIGQFGHFSVSLPYDAPTPPVGRVEVFTHSAQDGSEIELVSIPVFFSAEEAQIIEVYFSNTQADPDVMNCALVFAAMRAIEPTQAPARAALEAMLAGPTAIETDLGYTSNIQNGSQVSINSLVIEDGVAKVDFSSELEENAGGSCRVSAIVAQIRETLLQFDTVSEVEISIEGRTEDILQP